MLRGGKWAGAQVVPHQWVSRITKVFTPVYDMNPSRMRRGSFGYGFMWWVFDGPKTPKKMRGAYTAMGAFGQFLTVIPALDLALG